MKQPTKMASQLSDEDFQRLQTQLIDLKTSNYSLEEFNRNLQNEIGSLQQKLDVLEGEHQKAQRIIFKSKKIKEVESLLQENDNLQIKLQSQEDEFRLQNMTLMEELSTLLSGNDKLEKELQLAKQHEKSEKCADDGRQNESRRVLAENLALKKSLNEMQLNHDKEVSRLKNMLRDLHVKAAKESLNETTDGEGDKSVFQQAEKDDYEVVEVGEREVCYRKSCSSSASAMEVFQTIEAKNEELELRIKELSELKFLLGTEREEKRIMQEEMDERNGKQCSEIRELEDKIAGLTEKLKKKQDSLTQLQSEKERMYEENKNAITNLQQSKDLEIHQLQELSQRLQTQLKNALHSVQEVKEQTGRTIGDLESRVSRAHSEVEGQAAEKLRSLEADRIVLQSQLADAKTAFERCRNENEQLKEQLDAAFSQSESLVMRLSALEENNSVVTTTLDNVQKVADKRKMLLDEMAIHLQTKTDDNQREIARLVDEYTQQIEALNRKLEDGETLNANLEKARQKIDDLETEVQSLECTRGWFERRLNEAEETIQSASVHFESTLARKTEEHEANVRELNSEHETTVEDLRTQLEIANAQKVEFEEIIAKCEQETKDVREDRKIHDKKAASIVKDLKRQLLIERKRVEGLQERFQELLNESSHNRSGSVEPFKIPEVDRTETGSISSWSMMSGGGNSEVKEGVKDDGSGNISLQNGNSPTPSTNVLEENETLVAKCVALQEGKSDLEERLSYLEESNAAMAEDIVEKTAIIQYYCMKKTSDPNVRAAVDKITVKRVLDFIKDRGDENQRKINHRLQRILEEYLTKNMHLQKDMDALSKENAHLRGISAAAAATNPAPQQ